MNKDERGRKGQDFIAIAKDKKFQRLELSFKQKIDLYHDNFIRLSQIS
jgi:hypothetical protein